MTATLSDNPWRPDDAEDDGGVFTKKARRPRRRLVMTNGGKIEREKK